MEKITKAEKEFLGKYRALSVENRGIVDAFVQKLTQELDSQKNERRTNK